MRINLNGEKPSSKCVSAAERKFWQQDAGNKTVMAFRVRFCAQNALITGYNEPVK